MISKTIIKFHAMRFFRDYSKVAFYLSGFVIFLVIFAFSRYAPQSETLDKFIFSRTFLFNVLICLVLSAGVLGKEISDGFMNVILAKPIKKNTVYISKFTATIFFSTALLLFFLFCIGLARVFFHKADFPVIALLKVFLLLLIDQISIIAMSTFVSAWAPREMNITIMIFVIIILIFLPTPWGSDFSPILKEVFNFFNPVKSMAISKDFLTAKINTLSFFIKFGVYLLLLFTAGLGIFNKKEIRR